MRCPSTSSLPEKLCDGRHSRQRACAPSRNFYLWEGLYPFWVGSSISLVKPRMRHRAEKAHPSHASPSVSSTSPACRVSRRLDGLKLATRQVRPPRPSGGQSQRTGETFPKRGMACARLGGRCREICPSATAGGVTTCAGEAAFGLGRCERASRRLRAGNRLEDNQ